MDTGTTRDVTELALAGLVSTRHWPGRDLPYVVTGNLTLQDDHDDSQYDRQDKLAAHLTEHHPELVDDVEFDSESGMFCAYARTEQAARAVVDAAGEICADWYREDVVLARRAVLAEALAGRLDDISREPEDDRRAEAVRQIRLSARQAAVAEAKRLAERGWFDH